MFRTIRTLSETLYSLKSSVTFLTEAVSRTGDELVALQLEERDGGNLASRIEALELSHKKWEAEAEAMVLKATGKYEAARNAEERTRTMKKSFETDPESGPATEEELREAYVQLGLAVPGADGEQGNEGELSPLHPDVEDDPYDEQGYEVALRAKFR